jgi:hypothetical protein
VKRKPKHGGARRGAGRPREFKHKAQRIVLLEQTEADAVEELAWEAQMTLSKYLRRLIQRHLRAKGRLPPS